jgi:lipopolysaccharide assembly outer membrane protein LptD (OstA)
MHLPTFKSSRWTSFCRLTGSAILLTFISGIAVGAVEPAIVPPISHVVSPSETKVRKLKIVGDRTQFDEVNLSYFATGHAIATIEGQDAKVECDTIRYSDLNNIMDVRGNVKFIRNKSVTTGSTFRFKVGSDDYLVTEPSVRVVGPELVRR